MRRRLALFLALFTSIVLLLLSPRLLHNVLTPFAHRCTLESFEGISPGRFLRYDQYQYEWCEFGLPQPFEVIVAILASRSPASVFVAALLVMLLVAVSWVIWRAFVGKPQASA